VHQNFKKMIYMKIGRNCGQRFANERMFFTSQNDVSKEVLKRTNNYAFMRPKNIESFIKKQEKQQAKKMTKKQKKKT